jgi:hypothetical protein
VDEFIVAAVVAEATKSSSAPIPPPPHDAKNDDPAVSPVPSTLRTADKDKKSEPPKTQVKVVTAEKK